MATLTAARAAASFPVSGASARGVLQVAVGWYNITTALSQNDVIQFCRIPAGATIIGGYVQAKDIDTGTEAFDFDLGWAGNGVESADPDGLGNFGVWTGDAITDLRPEVGILYPLGNTLFTGGPQSFTNETIIQGVCNTAANAGGTGNITVVVHYIIPTA